MQVTIDIPESLARRLNTSGDTLLEILEDGLRLRGWAGGSGVGIEVINFLGRGPRPEEIIKFHPSDAVAERARHLLEKTREGTVTSSEKSELDEMALMDFLMTQIKARAFQQLNVAA